MRFRRSGPSNQHEDFYVSMVFGPLFMESIVQSIVESLVQPIVLLMVEGS